MNTPKLDPELKNRLRDDPEGPIRLIVRVCGNLEARARELGTRGLTVYRRLPLIGALALVAAGGQALALSRERWVVRIEEDGEVRAMGSPQPTADQTGRAGGPGPAGGDGG